MTSSADEVAAALGAWLGHRFDGPVAVVGTPAANTGGFDSAIYFVQYSGATLPADWQEPLVVRVKPRPDALEVARVEAACHGWLADNGYPVPRILEVLDPDVVTPRPTRVMAVFELAGIATPHRIERSILDAVGPVMARVYRRAYERLLPLDAERLALWRPAYLIHAWAQTLGAHAGRFDDEGHLASRLPKGLLDGLQRRFVASITSLC